MNLIYSTKIKDYYEDMDSLKTDILKKDKGIFDSIEDISNDLAMKKWEDNHKVLRDDFNKVIRKAFIYSMIIIKGKDSTVGQQLFENADKFLEYISGFGDFSMEEIDRKKCILHLYETDSETEFEAVFEVKKISTQCKGKLYNSWRDKWTDPEMLDTIWRDTHFSNIPKILDIVNHNR